MILTIEHTNGLQIDYPDVADHSAAMEILKETRMNFPEASKGKPVIRVSPKHVFVYFMPRP